MLAPLILSLFVAAVPQGADKVTAARVFVFTDLPAGGERTPDEQGRLDAVREVKEALAKKKGITVVDTRADANVIIDVTGREQKDDVQGGFGGKMITPLGDTIIRMHISSGDRESELKGMGQGTWGRAAKDAADRVLKWIARAEPPR
jgi:hypothetical protein